MRCAKAATATISLRNKPPHRFSVSLIMLALAALSFAARASGCPFCTALKPSLAQQRDGATIALLGECRQVSDRRFQFRLLQPLHGEERLQNKETLSLSSDDFADPPPDMKAGCLVLLLARPRPEAETDALRWNVVVLNETSYAYAARAPSTRRPARERLPFFVSFLEHPDPLLAEDAYLEFGHARFDEVGEIAEQLPMASFRQWLIDGQVPQERKGFYGMALGLAPAGEPRRENAAFLRKLIEQPSSDFRAGFDGLLGGYLLAGGEEALKFIDRKYLADPDAPPGDVRHAMTALRFYHEFGRQIPRERLAESLMLLLERRQFAAAAIVDLARWQAWQTTEAVARLGRGDEMKDRPTRRSVISFLLLSPTPLAKREAARLRERYPQETADAEKQLNLTSQAR